MNASSLNPRLVDEFLTTLDSINEYAAPLRQQRDAGSTQISHDLEHSDVNDLWVKVTRLDSLRERLFAR